MSFEFAGLTDVGRKREHNEDALLMLPDCGLAAVADGMGGHNAGEVASSIAVKTLEWFFQSMAHDPEATWPFRQDARYDENGNRLLVGIQLANGRIRESAHEEGRQGMGTTVVAGLFVDDRAYIAWVGDSRGYSFRNGELAALTADHSLQNELLRSGRIRPQDLAGFQHRNVITRALGIADKVEPELHRIDLSPDDVILLCCDGLTTMVDDAGIAAILAAEPDVNAAARKLLDAANEAGGADNITVVLARYRPDAPPPPPPAPEPAPASEG